MEASSTAGSLFWAGHATLILTSPRGTRVVVDPWLNGNPMVQAEWRTIDAAEAIVLTHGHSDHITDAVSVASATGAPTISNPEVAAFLATQGVEPRIEMNKGGTVEVGGVRMTMVHADHSSGITVGENAPLIEGGEPAGIVFRGDDFAPLYVAGDTNVFGDMALIRELYRPRLAVLPIDGHYNMGPVEAAYACDLLGVAQVVPVHWGTFPLLTGTPDALERELRARGTSCEVLSIQPGGRVPVPAA